MDELMRNFVDKTVQCWGCELFDRLFQVINVAVTAVYDNIAQFCMILMLVIFAFMILNAFYQNMKALHDNKSPDTWYKKSVQKAFVNSAFVLALLGLGVTVPRLITTITFEPVATTTQLYSQAIIGMNQDEINERVTYQPIKLDNTQQEMFFRPQLRDRVILLMKTTIAEFQSYIKLGIAMMDKAFSWDALLKFGLGSIMKHVALFMAGLYIFITFMRIFMQYCFRFADVIVAMAMFAFFFPLSLMMMAFKDVEHVPDWLTHFGKGVGTDQFKKLVNAIVALASCVITYTVIMVILAKFFSDPDVASVGLMEKITTGQIFESDLSLENLEDITLIKTVILTYVMVFIYKQIPQVTKTILSAFNVGEETSLSDQLAKDAERLVTVAAQGAVKVGKIIASGGEEKKDE
ncbi:MAG: hypothetical protein J6S06_01790 [Alphaproteobacteria bacterium]|nr:hypothetical protein [Alphaproteobacteria bacterium]